MLIAEMLLVARAKINEKLLSNAPGVRYWLAASDALKELEDRKDLLEGITDTQMVKFLETLNVSDSTPDIGLAAIAFASADDVIASVEQGTKELNADTALRKQRRDALIAIFDRLGGIGAKLVLGAFGVPMV